jgi:putative photosynthetic complex assembly protein
MSTQRKDQITGYHKWPLFGALGVVVFTLLLVLASVWLEKDAVALPQAETIQHRDLYFRDATNGKVVVYDAKTKKRLGGFGKGEGAFVRISMRSMAHQRKKREIDLMLPYRLVKLSDGNMKIVDPQSGHSIRLNAFGAVAIDSFAQFLTNQPQEGAQG